ncbi:relaxase family protein [Bifidobacterium animalis]|uniref:Relaxase n=1 Tax=Bifidobacterium animalis subsp. lactis TaxID=302911 RepID=A0A8B3RIN1_BIFAN|nr:relaxase/mobilization nuclease domain-containing protein [Bifidobacterium animalis]RYM95312.1 relaxase [Bifidobacterium animalis subsp. lactis]
MSTTYVQPLPDVQGRMSYTEFGGGKKRREHIANGTNRIVAQYGDMPSRGEFVAYCKENKLVHPNALNEGFELRVSWATDELDPNNPDDIQRGMEHAYLLCHELAPDSPCWVTMHTDGDGGCVHAHATIVNHDVRTGLAINKGDTSLYAPRVQAVNDELSRANGLQVLGADKSHTTWEERSATLDAKSFDRHLGDKIAFARDNADSMEAFKKNLEYAGVTLTETAKTDKKTGEVTTGWSYKAKDVWGPKMRTRKRRASKLCDEFTKDGIEAYFEEKQAQAEEQAQKAPTEPEVVAAVPEDVPQDVRTHQPPEPEPIPAVPEPDTPQEDFHVYEPSADDVSDMAGDLRRAYVRHCEGKGQNYMDDTYHRFVSVQADPHDAWLELHAEVARAREEFHRTKAELDAVKQQRKDFAVGMAIFRAVNRKSQSPMARMMADMYAMMFQQMMQAKREEAERKLYERRKAMWDAEKALKNELKRGEIGYKPHELPESLKRITEGYGRSDDDKSLGDW